MGWLPFRNSLCVSTNPNIMPLKYSLLLTCFWSFSLFAQKGTFLLGGETHGTGVYYKDSVPDTTYTFSAIGFVPYAGIGISKNVTIGVTGLYNRINYDGYRLDELKGIGLFAKYIYQPQINPERKLLSRIGFPVIIQALVGFNVRVFRNFYLEWSYTPRWHLGKNMVNDAAVSFEYRFGGKYKDEALPKLTWPERDKTKRAFAKTVVIGSSAAAIYDTDANNELDYWDFSWSKNIAINLTDKFYLGINHTDIWANHVSTNSKHRSTITGLFTQYDMTKAGDKFKALVELGYYVGNHCTCGSYEGNPQKSDNLLSYLGWGVGLEHRFAKQFSMDFMWNVTLILNKDIEEKYAHVMPNIGLNYYIGTY